jgi:hypothetical protein
MNFEKAGIRFQPWLPEDIAGLSLHNLHYRNAILNLYLSGHGSQVKNFVINGKRQPIPLFPANFTGEGNLNIILGE